MFELSKKGAAGRGQDEPVREQGDGRITTPAVPARGAVTSGSHREAAVIGPSIHIDGDLRGEEDLLIEGEVNGTVQLKSNSLTIGQHGKVRADVFAHSVYVEGLMEGDLHGSERVVIRKTAEVRGNITSPRVSLEEGARFKGAIEMDGEAVKGAVGTSHSGHRGTAATGASKSGAAAAGKDNADAILRGEPATAARSGAAS